MKTNLSIVIPLFNEEKNIKLLFETLNKLKNKYPKNTEIILVDDGSNDNTVNKINDTKLLFSKKLISFSKNFGHQAALLAGLNESKGQMIVSMDGDLQHPPELIVKMIKLHKQGFEIVLTQKIDRNVTSGFKKISSKLFYKLINVFSNTPIIDSASDFRLMGRNSLNTLLSLPENRKFLRGLVSWIGFEQIIIPFEVQKRAFGNSKYSLKKMLKLGLTGITSFSTLPLYFAGAIGLLMTFFSMMYSIYILIQYFQGQTVSGWASLLLVTLVLSSFIFIFLGVIGVYLAAIYDEVKGRPNYIIKDIPND